MIVQRAHYRHMGRNRDDPLSHGASAKMRFIMFNIGEEAASQEEIQDSLGELANMTGGT